jgi:hypothetical protein
MFGLSACTTGFAETFSAGAAAAKRVAVPRILICCCRRVCSPLHYTSLGLHLAQTESFIHSFENLFGLLYLTTFTHKSHVSLESSRARNHL